MALKELLTDLSNFKYTDYENVGANNSQIGGRHSGIKPGESHLDAKHPEEHSKFDDGIGFGVDPNDNPQSFTVRGYQVTGNKRFYIGPEGDFLNYSFSDYHPGIWPDHKAFGVSHSTLAGVFDHTQVRDRSRKAYDNYDIIEFGTDGSVHVGDQDLAGVIGGGLNYYGSLVSITPRGSIYRDDSENYQVPQEGGNTNPPGGISNIPLFEGIQITHNIPQITLTGPFGDEDYQSTLNVLPRIPGAHGSDFMVTPLGESSLPSNTVTHNVDMITLSGPTSQTYQTQINTTPIADGAHGSDFQTTPIEAYSSIFATQDGLLMDTIYDSGFNRGDMYITDHPHQSHPEFGEFNRTEKSLNKIELNSPNFDSDGNKEFTFKDRAPYNIPARDNTVFGFDQPFILKDIGDKWGPGGLGAVDEGLFRGGFVTSAARTVADVQRIGKFLLTPKGIMFGLKQTGLQLLNPREETRIWNPLSLASIAPMVHMDRHLDTSETKAIYEWITKKTGIDLSFLTTGEGSVLGEYALAIEQGPYSGRWATATKMRTTLAHLTAMVPSSKGKISLPAVPELKFDLDSGTIYSLSPKKLKYGNKYADEDILAGNKRYVLHHNKGSIIPSRNPQASFKKAEEPERGQSITDLVQSVIAKVTGAPGDRFEGSPLQQHFYEEDWDETTPIVTGVQEEDVFQGHFTLPGKTSVKGPGSYSSLFKVLQEPYKSLFGVTEQSIGEVVFVGKSGLKSGKPAVQPFLSYNVKPSGDIGPTISIYNPLIPEGERGALQGFNRGSGLVYDTLNADYPAELQIRKEGIFLGDLYNKDNRYGKGYQYTVDQSPLYIIGGTDSDYGLAQAKIKQVYKITSDTVTIGTEKVYNTHPSISGEGVSFGGLSRGERIFNDSFEGDLYDSENKYTDIIGGSETQSSPLKKTRLRIDDDKDPVVQIQTAHLNTARFNVDGRTTLSGPIKLQNFPLFNNQSGGNLGSEKQSLGFIDEAGTPIKLADNLYGHQWNVNNRGTETTKDGYEKSIKSAPETDEETLRGIVDEGRFGLSNQELPQVIKKLFTVNDNTDTGVDLGDNVVKSQIVQDIHVRTVESNKTGNLLDRYKTLAYGDIPKQGADTKRYDKKKDKSPVKEGDTTSLSTVAFVDDDELGLIKKTLPGKDGKYTTDLVDKVNMYQYGNGDIQDDADYIKFKIYDVVNSKYIIFRAFLSGISETLSPEWASERYIGRPDSVHVYQGVERSMSFEFMIVPSSKQELPILWEKMNYLVGLTYPTWKPLGTTGKRMESPFIQLTIGDMYNSVPGYFSSLGITVDDQSPWELDDGFQLPHAVNVTCEFTHIGQHALASQGKHFDLPFLRNYNSTNDPQLGDRTGLEKLMGKRFIPSTLAASSG